tara:strand:- start:796 stop:1215 length:420 start_codon:yes stop_codon:yes gene_type:complete
MTNRYYNNLYVCARAAGDNVSAEDHAYMFPTHRTISCGTSAEGVLDMHVMGVKNDAGWVANSHATNDVGVDDLIQLQYKLTAGSTADQASFLEMLKMMDDVVAACNNVTPEGFTTLADESLGLAFGNHINSDVVSLAIT